MSESVINIRAAVMEDTREISNVLALSWKTAYRGIIDDGYLDALDYKNWMEFLSTGLKDGSVFSMVIECGREIIGAAVLSPIHKGREVDLIAFYLLPEKTGKGIGSAFYREIEAELLSNGASGCIVHVLEGNTSAIRFYQKLGFADTSKKTSVVLAEQKYTCKVLKKEL